MRTETKLIAVITEEQPPFQHEDLIPVLATLLIPTLLVLAWALERLAYRARRRKFIKAYLKELKDAKQGRTQ